MKIEQQVCSLELAHKLKELGVKQESYFKWCYQQNGENYFLETNDNFIMHYRYSEINFTMIMYAAYTASELGELLGVDVHIQLSLQNDNPEGSWYCYYQPEHGTDNSMSFSDDNLANVLAQVLITKLTEEKYNAI